MFVLMIEQTLSRPSRICDDAEFNDRFWFWQGASGRNYIHSVYPAGQCPPLAGAIFIAVTRDPATGACRALDCGRLGAFGHMSSHNADEVHVHMLARDEAEGTQILNDLRQALFGTAPVEVDAAGDAAAEVTPCTGFSETQLPLFSTAPEAAMAAC